MKLEGKIRLLIAFWFCFLIFPKDVFGQENKFVTIVHPLRGGEVSSGNLEYLNGIKYQKYLIEKYNLKATWLFREDTFSDIKDYIKDFKGHELGIFFEVTPQLAKKANVSYPVGGVFWHDADKIFLSGYKPEDRLKLVDVAFGEFKEQTGYFPKSVGAWHIDAFSAGYMKQKYGVTGVLICADQFGTDGYQIWGGWWGVPYYPSKYNILAPAQSNKNKLNLVVYWWAARDPVLGYGGSVNNSTYSVQVNDYLQHGLGIDYFRKLLDIYLQNPKNDYAQLTVGMENDNDWQKIGDGYEKQLEEISRRVQSGEIKVKTMSEFSQWYLGQYSWLSPTHFIGNWEMSTDYRVGVKNNEIFDLRIYNELWPEASLETANPWETLSLNNPYKIDTVRFENSNVKSDFGIINENLVKKFGALKIPFKVSKYFLLSCYLVIMLGAYLLCKNIPFLLLVLIGSILISIPMVKSGLVYDYGMSFWGPNGHDGIWHIALINQLSKFSTGNPVFSGTRLTNYHFGFDFMAAFLSHLTGIIPVNLYFQIIPPVMAVLIGFLTYKFVEKWTGSKFSGWWATFFVYFGGSWGWLAGLIKDGKLGGESMFWANQSVSTLINPPYALSLIILLVGLTKFLDYLKNSSKKNLLLCSLFWGILIQVKVYAGIIILCSLLGLLIITSIHRCIEVKKLQKVFLLTLLVSLVVFLPFNLKASSLLVFSPLWFPRSMIAYADRVGWIKLENARIAYLNSGKYFKWLTAELLAVTIFILGNLGTRVIGFLYGGFFWRKRKVLVIESFLLLCLVVSLVIPLLFIQKGNPWNTIQFFYYFQLLMSIFAGVVVGNWIELRLKTSRYYIFIYVSAVLLAGITLMTTITTLKNDYLPSRPPSRISIEELEALNFLKKQPMGNVLSYPFNSDWRFKFSEPKPLYAYETTAYISALSGQSSFLADEMNLEITGYNWRSRKNDEARFFVTDDSEWANQFLEVNKIKYIYLVKGQKMNLGLGDISSEKIFENGETVIYQVN